MFRLYHRFPHQQEWKVVSLPFPNMFEVGLFAEVLKREGRQTAYSRIGEAGKHEV